MNGNFCFKCFTKLLTGGHSIIDIIFRISVKWKDIIFLCFMKDLTRRSGVTNPDDIE